MSTRLPGDRAADFFYSAPALAVLAVIALLPLGVVSVYGFLNVAPDGTLRGFTFANYARAFDPLYASVLLYSARHALLTTALALLIAFPCALALRAMPPARRVFVLALIVVPSWLNLLVKNYAWIVVLRREGVVNTVLQFTGLISEPLPFLFNDYAIQLGLLHTYLPFMILPVYAAIDRMDWALVDAARDLGARPWQQFLFVILPQTRAGVAAGAALVFIPALGAFVTPDLLGGTGNLMIANLIENQVQQVHNWPFASALSTLLIALVILAVFLVRRFHAQQVAA